MDSITVGPFAFSVSLALILLSVAIAFAVANWMWRRHGVEIEQALWKILITGFVAARAAFVLAYLESYMQAPLSIIDIRDGGFIASAGVAAALALAGWFAWRKSSWRKPLLLSLLSGATIWGGASAAILLYNSGATLPQMTMTRLEGPAVQLDSFRGKPVVVNLWATWCPPCRREMPVLRDAQLREKDVAFVFANQGESAETVRRYLGSQSLALGNVLLDPGRELARQTGSHAMPTTLFYDAKGRLVDTRVGELSAATLAKRIDSMR